MELKEKIYIANLLRSGANEMLQQEECRWGSANTMRSWEEWRSEANRSLYAEMMTQADSLDGNETWIGD